jgi:hypothetical protein
MRTAIFFSMCLLSACTPSYTQTVKSPDDVLAEQEALGDEQVKKSKEQSDYSSSANPETESDKAQKFDEVYTEREVSRAVRSAVTCPGVSGAGPYGDAKVTVIFNNEGHVVADKTTISEPFAGTPNGDCVLRAINAIITKNFVGQPVTKEITVKLEQAAKKDEKADKKKK